MTPPQSVTIPRAELTALVAEAVVGTATFMLRESSPGVSGVPGDTFGRIIAGAYDRSPPRPPRCLQTYWPSSVYITPPPRQLVSA